MAITEVKPVSKTEAIVYMMPILKEITKMNLEYEIVEKLDLVIIKIPNCVPVKK